MKKEEFLAMSLPYELKCLYNGIISYDIVTEDDFMGDSIRVDENHKYGEKIGILKEIHRYKKNYKCRCGIKNTGLKSFFNGAELYPIIHPLSELELILLSEFEKYHKNIDCNNEIIELFYEEHIKTSDLISEINIESLPFDTVIWMIKNHFDIAGLIEKGEAIDVNTLPENPYK